MRTRAQVIALSARSLRRTGRTSTHGFASPLREQVSSGRVNAQCTPDHKDIVHDEWFSDRNLLRLATRFRVSDGQDFEATPAGQVCPNDGHLPGPVPRSLEVTQPLSLARSAKLPRVCAYHPLPMPLLSQIQSSSWVQVSGLAAKASNASKSDPIGYCKPRACLNAIIIP